jgi:hypothetical protein
MDITLAVIPAESKLIPMPSANTSRIDAMGVAVVLLTLPRNAEAGSILSRASANDSQVATTMLAKTHEKMAMKTITCKMAPATVPNWYWKM